MLIKDVFISYGRRESLGFAAKLYQRLVQQGYTAWFDQVNIPAGDDYQKRIDNGIESAHNFVFVIAPRSVESVNCAKEVELAIKLGKRIIPVLHVQPDSSSWAKMSPDAKKGIRKRDWVNIREQLGDLDTLRNWADSQEWTDLQDDELLKNWKSFAEFTSLDSFEVGFMELHNLLKKNKEYVEQHTQILLQALYWQKQNNSTRLLLTGRERAEAVKWLTYEFRAPEQPPCEPTDLMANLVCESTQNANNQQVDVFFCYQEPNPLLEPIKNYLHRQAYTTWDYSTDLLPGINITDGIQKGIANSDNFLFLVTPETISGTDHLESLHYALQLNKRVIPVVVSDVLEKDFPEPLKKLRAIQFKALTDLAPEADPDYKLTAMRQPMGELIRQIETDRSYFTLHTRYGFQALRWEKQNKINSLLLRGNALKRALEWLALAQKRDKNGPIALQIEFLKASEAHKDEVATDIFLSYSLSDAEFAQKLNIELQMLGQSTWFDREFLPSDEESALSEIYSGIDLATNFMLVCGADTANDPLIKAEIEYALKVGKKCFVGIIGAPQNTKPNQLANAVTIDYRPKTLHEGTAELLASFREVDKHHVQMHNRWQLKAQEWQKVLDKKTDLATHKETAKEAAKINPLEFLLPDAQCVMAKEWYEEAVTGNKTPPPTALQKLYIEESEKGVAIRKQRRLKRAQRNQIYSISVSIALVMSIILGAWAIINRIRVENLSKKAEVTAQVAEKKAIDAQRSEANAKAALAQLEQTMAKVENLSSKLTAVKQEEKVLKEKELVQNKISDLQFQKLNEEKRALEAKQNSLQAEYNKALRDYEKLKGNLEMHTEQLENIIEDMEANGFFEKKRKKNNVSPERAKTMLKELLQKLQKLEK
ncbi:MAG: TIR domain-containing protein [Cytophagales bacterium]|nr:MAG: TIR domain-containing protein [Cytophagales bacterium]TAF59770.1 MAG: TIR domain-containing protein [Cytophagales bacterium]